MCCRRPFVRHAVEDAVGEVTGDKIAGATGSEVKFRIERKLGGTVEEPPQVTGNSAPSWGSAAALGACPTRVFVVARGPKVHLDRAKALTPQRLRNVFIPFGGPLRAMERSLAVAVR